MCAQNSNAKLARRELDASGIGQRQRGGCSLLQKGCWGWKTDFLFHVWVVTK